MLQTGINVLQGPQRIQRNGKAVVDVIYADLKTELAPSPYDPTLAADAASTHRYLWLCAPTGSKKAQAYFYRCVFAGLKAGGQMLQCCTTEQHCPACSSLHPGHPHLRLIPCTPALRRSNPLKYHETQNAGLYGMIAVEKAVLADGTPFPGWTMDETRTPPMPLRPIGIDKELAIVIHVQLEDASFCADINCYTVRRCSL